MSDAAAEFWRFSLAIYARPEVPPACLILQDQFGRDVNVALYCCWIGASGRGVLSRAALDSADRKVAPWRHEVVEPLRAARRAIKAATLEGTESLYTRAKTVELEAERQLQYTLAALAPPSDSTLSDQDKLAAALANLALYVGDAPSGPIQAALRDMAEDHFAVG